MNFFGDSSGNDSTLIGYGVGELARVEAGDEVEQLLKIDPKILSDYPMLFDQVLKIVGKQAH